MKIQVLLLSVWKDSGGNPDANAVNCILGEKRSKGAGSTEGEGQAPVLRAFRDLEVIKHAGRKILFLISLNISSHSHSVT